MTTGGVLRGLRTVWRCQP